MASTSATGHRLSAPWKALLQNSLAQNKSLVYSKYVQLATVRANGRPANRTVVFRGFFQDTDDVTFVTDRRSSKVEEAASNPAAEVCWYFPVTREQYRLSGDLTIITGDDPDDALRAARQQAWAALTGAARAQFCWPTPGLPRLPENEGSYSAAGQPAATEPAAPAFCLVLMHIHEVDHINLFSNRRVAYRKQQQHHPVAAASGVGADGDGGPDTEQQSPALVWEAQDVNP